MTGPGPDVPDVPDVPGAPIELPTMPAAQHDAWLTLMKMENEFDGSWVLIGGQMTMLHCLEQDVPFTRATTDADVVCDVLSPRRKLADMTALLGDWGFHAVVTADGCGYRYTRGATSLDLTIQDTLERQVSRARTSGGRPGLPVDGGNQALLRAERVGVTVAGVTGRVRRPTLLGALVIKAAAVVVDTRDPRRHQEDLALLGAAALRSPEGFRGVARLMRAHDSTRLRRALDRTPSEDTVWSVVEDGATARAGLEAISAQST